MNLFVVREVNDAFNTVNLLSKMGVNSTSFPITTFLSKKIPNYKQKYDFVIITSSKSIKIFIRYLNLYKKIHFKIPKIFVVGHETGNELRKKQFFNFHEATGNSRDIIKLILIETSNYQKGLWLCGFHRQENLKKIFLKNKRFIDQRVVYEMRAIQSITEANLNKTKTSLLNSFIVNSSRNVLLLSQLLKKYDIFNKVTLNSKIFCMSEAIRKYAFSLGWKDVIVINNTNRTEFLKKVITHF